MLDTRKIKFHTLLTIYLRQFILDNAYIYTYIFYMQKILKYNYIYYLQLNVTYIHHPSNIILNFA